MEHSVRLTYPVLWFAVFGRQLCLPLPAILFLMVAGALSERGGLNPILILITGVLGCLAADLVWFEAGRRCGSRVMHLLCGLSDDPQYCTQRARASFSRWGPRTLLVAKVVPGLDGVTPPLAGLLGTPRHVFLAYDSGGSLLWSGLYVGIGYVFADRLELATGYVIRFGSLLALCVGLPLLIYIGWRAVVLVRMVHQLGLRKLSPLQLYQKMEDNAKMVIIDLLKFEDSESLDGIPGAIRVDPNRFRSRHHVIVPGDLTIVLYCYSGGGLTIARVALSLKKKGIPRVWILEGGLAAWKQDGFPVSPILPATWEAIERAGIQIPDLDETASESYPVSRA
jgi:membrane protein DedA with SNARE-associated domain/rhodanese-related sulfurtransferase